MFSDVDLNTRVYICFFCSVIIAIAVNTLLIPEHIYMNGAIGVSGLGYTMDLFTLPLLKIYSRRYKVMYTFFDEFSFLAQKQIEDYNMVELVLDEEVNTYLLECARENFSQENYYFISDCHTELGFFADVEIDNNTNNNNDTVNSKKFAHRENVTIESLQNIVDKYISSSAEFELNLASGTKSQLLKDIKKLKESEVTEIKITKAEHIFGNCIQEVKKLLLDNIYPLFIKKEQVKKVIARRQKLQSALTKTNTGNLNSSFRNTNRSSIGSAIAVE
eukprot:Pgem_evm1s6126